MSEISLHQTSGDRARSRRRLFQILLAAAVAPAVQKVQSILLLYKSEKKVNSNDTRIRIRGIIIASDQKVQHLVFHRKTAHTIARYSIIVYRTHMCDHM